MGRHHCAGRVWPSAGVCVIMLRQSTVSSCLSAEGGSRCGEISGTCFFAHFVAITVWRQNEDTVSFPCANIIVHGWLHTLLVRRGRASLFCPLTDDRREYGGGCQNGQYR